MPQQEITKHEWKQWRSFKWEKICIHCECKRIGSVMRKGTPSYKPKGEERLLQTEPACITRKISDDDR